MLTFYVFYAGVDGLKMVLNSRQHMLMYNIIAWYHCLHSYNVVTCRIPFVKIVSSYFDLKNNKNFYGKNFNEKYVNNI